MGHEVDTTATMMMCRDGVTVGKHDDVVCGEAPVNVLGALCTHAIDIASVVHLYHLSCRCRLISCSHALLHEM
jgi:hypothetical protein